MYDSLEDIKHQILMKELFKEPIPKFILKKKKRAIFLSSIFIIIGLVMLSISLENYQYIILGFLASILLKINYSWTLRSLKKGAIISIYGYVEETKRIKHTPLGAILNGSVKGIFSNFSKDYNTVNSSEYIKVNVLYGEYSGEEVFINGRGKNIKEGSVIKIHLKKEHKPLNIDGLNILLSYEDIEIL